MFDLSLITPSSLSLPEKFSNFRDSQVSIVNAFMNKTGNLLADAPTGTGKSLIGPTIQKLTDVPIVFITPTKDLQRQICDEFPYARMVMGKENYDCLLNKEVKANCCTHEPADPCPYLSCCPYRIARDDAENSPFAVLNNTFYLYASYYAHKYQNRPILIVDEIDQFENILLSFIKVDFTFSMQRKLRDLGFKLRFGDDINTWVSWCKEVLPHVNDVIGRLKKDRELKELETWKRLESKIVYMINNIDTTWIREDSTDEDTDAFCFRPITVEKYVPSIVWNNHSRTLGMSGTILKPWIIKKSLGLTADYIQVPCPFPIENRPIYDATITHFKSGSEHERGIDNFIPEISDRIQKIINHYPDGKILIHTFTEHIAELLSYELDDERVITYDKYSKQQVLAEFKTSSKPLVLLSYSYARGLDLVDDVYKCIIVVKAPFISMGGAVGKRKEQMDKERKSSGQQWYMRDAAATLMQMCGRGVRSMSKKCDMWILDKWCLDLITTCPAWFSKALVRKEDE